MQPIIILLFSIVMLTAGGFNSPEIKNGDFHIFILENKDEKVNPQMIEAALKSKGFIVGENANIQAELLHIFHDDNFKIYNNISIYHKELTLTLLKKYANAGILLPMGIVVYQAKAQDNLHIVVPRAKMQSKVIGVNFEELQSLERSVLELIKELFPNARHEYSDTSKEHDKDFLTKYTLELEGNDFEDAKEELEENFEEKFAQAGFAMPSYFDITEDLGKDSPYDFYVSYAICKMDVLRIAVKVNPQAAALGPCTTMIYKKKDENEIVMGFASMHNWISSANIEDKVLVDALLELQNVYENILKDVTKN